MWYRWSMVDACPLLLEPEESPKRHVVPWLFEVSGSGIDALIGNFIQPFPSSAWALDPCSSRLLLERPCLIVDRVRWCFSFNWVGLATCARLVASGWAFFVVGKARNSCRKKKKKGQQYNYVQYLYHFCDHSFVEKQPGEVRNLRSRVLECPGPPSHTCMALLGSASEMLQQHVLCLPVLCLTRSCVPPWRLCKNHAKKKKLQTPDYTKRRIFLERIPWASVNFWRVRWGWPLLEFGYYQYYDTWARLGLILDRVRLTVPLLGLMKLGWLAGLVLEVCCFLGVIASLSETLATGGNILVRSSIYRKKATNPTAVLWYRAATRIKFTFMIALLHDTNIALS